MIPQQVTEQTAWPKSRKEPVHLKVIKGGFVPADQYSESLLRKKKFKVGDVIKAYISKPRNAKFNRLVHKLGLLCAENIEDFRGMDGHSVLKRLQLEGNICCDEIAIKIHNFDGAIWSRIHTVINSVLDLIGFKLTQGGMLIVRVPRSLSFDSLDEAEFHDAARSMCRFIAEQYWKDLSAEKIEEMAKIMVDE